MQPTKGKKMINAIVVDVEGDVEQIEIAHDDTLRTLQGHVDGLIEAVDSADGSVTFWVNEEGKLIGLPINRAATLMWWTLNPAMKGLDALCGTVVITGGPDAEGDTTSVPAFIVVEVETPSGRFA